ncbi:MAG: PhoH family protein [Phycisphaerales bacterium]|nr:PhoH family protein [Phycisphaerales bacterium]
MLGLGDRNLKIIREALGVKVSAREGVVRVSGEQEPVSAARGVLERLGVAAERNEPLSSQEVLDLIGRAMSGELRVPSAKPIGGTGGNGFDDADREYGPAWDRTLDVYAAGQPLRARTPNQQVYLDAIRDHDLVFGIGPAGTGKTYLAVAAAVHLLKADRVRKVILARPAVEAGEKLGFLPGDLQAKVNPYLRPLFDALHDMMDFPTIKRFMLNDVVEVVPLAYMRGRTLNNAVIILDEAQNTTKGQMQMFLTRMGRGSKMIITGDTTQIDLPDPTQSGLIDAARLLSRVKGIGFVTLDERDIVRHHLVQRIVEAYGRRDQAGRQVRGFDIHTVDGAGVADAVGRGGPGSSEAPQTGAEAPSVAETRLPDGR